MKIRKFKIILSIFLIIGIAVGGMLGYYDARLEASVNQGKSLNSVDVGDNLTFNKDVVNILLVGSDHGAIKGDHGRSDSSAVFSICSKSSNNSPVPAVPPISFGTCIKMIVEQIPVINPPITGAEI